MVDREPVFEALFHVYEGGTRHEAATIAVSWSAGPDEAPRVWVAPAVDEAGVRFLYRRAGDETVDEAGIRRRLQAVHADVVADVQRARDREGRVGLPTAADPTAYQVEVEAMPIGFDFWVIDQPFVTPEALLAVLSDASNRLGPEPGASSRSSAPDDVLVHVTRNIPTEVRVADIGISWARDGRPARVHVVPRVTPDGARFLRLYAQPPNAASLTELVAAAQQQLHDVVLSHVVEEQRAGWPAWGAGRPGAVSWFSGPQLLLPYRLHTTPGPFDFDVWLADHPAPGPETWTRAWAAIAPAAPPTNDWISVLEIAPDADGVRGGPWRLTVTRVPEAGSHWWPWSEDDDHPSPVSVLRGSDGSAISVRVHASDLPFEQAAEAYGLDPAVFGSRTLWPCQHMNHTASNGGWTWLHRSAPAHFPFRPPPTPAIQVTERRGSIRCGIARDSGSNEPLFGFISDDASIAFRPAAGYYLEAMGDLQSREYVTGHAGLSGEERLRRFFEHANLRIGDERGAASYEEAAALVDAVLSRAADELVSEGESLNTLDPWWAHERTAIYEVRDMVGNRPPGTGRLAATLLVWFSAGCSSLPRVEVVPTASEPGLVFMRYAGVDLTTDAGIEQAESVRRDLAPGLAVRLRDWRLRARQAFASEATAANDLVYRVALPTLHQVAVLESAGDFDELATAYLRSRPSPGAWTRAAARYLFDRSVYRGITYRPRGAGQVGTAVDDEAMNRIRHDIEALRPDSPRIAKEMRQLLDQLPRDGG